MNWFLNRLREPSTWAGLAGLILSVGQLGKIHEAQGIADAVQTLGPMIGSAAAVFVPEAK